jgi:cystathionine beta-synthase
MVAYASTVLDLVGDTPLLRLRSEGDALLLGKLELVNPGGSVKDRIAVRMVDAAERSGALRPGGVIVEPTSGNTGIGLAIVGQQRGYRCIFVCPDKVAHDKIAVLRAYGADVVVCPTAVAPDHPDSYYSTSDRLVRETPGAWKPDQYSNPENPASHQHGTGPEIWEQTEGAITHFVAGIGTGGTITGVGRFLKEVSDGRVEVVGADPLGSVYSGGDGRPYLVEGVGEDFWPTAYDPSVVDRVIAVSDRDSFCTTRELARTEGLLVGGSSGMAVVAARQVAAGAGERGLVVVLLPDGGRGYLSKIFDDRWMADYGFLDTGEGEVLVGAVFEAKAGDRPDLVHVHPDETVGTAIEILREYEVSHLPVVRAEPPVKAAEVVGSVNEHELLRRLVSGQATLDEPLEAHMSAPLPLVGTGEPISELVAALEGTSAALVLEDGQPLGVLTSQDVLAFLAEQRS